MKICLILFTAYLLTNLNYGYKLNYDDLEDSEEIYEHIKPQRYQNLKREYNLYNNKQLNLYEDDSKAYQEALAALVQAAQEEQDENNSDSAEINLDELINSPIAYDDVELKANTRDEELESHSSLIAGHQYVSGGAGEGKQHLQPDGHINNKEEIKTDEDLPAYCDPPNPCPLGHIRDDCDSRPYSEYTAEFSKRYQEQQNCMCDDDHNECSKSTKGKSTDKINDLIENIQNKLSPVVAKKSPRIRRDVQNETKLKRNPYLRGEAIRIHVAKKSSKF